MVNDGWPVVINEKVHHGMSICSVRGQIFRFSFLTSSETSTTQQTQHNENHSQIRHHFPAHFQSDSFPNQKYSETIFQPFPAHFGAKCHMFCLTKAFFGPPKPSESSSSLEMESKDWTCEKDRPKDPAFPKDGFSPSGFLFDTTTPVLVGYIYIL